VFVPVQPYKVSAQPAIHDYRRWGGCGAHPEVSSDGIYCNLEPMNWSEEPRKFTCRSPKIWKQRKAELEELWRQGQNWALAELQQLRQAERVKRHVAYQQFKARRTPEVLRAKWREVKAAQRAATAAVRREAEERERKEEELAANAAALAAEAERERKAREPIAEGGDEIELEILRTPSNPRMVLCRYWAGNEERRCMVRVGRNGHFVRGMKLSVQEPSDPGAQSQPWPYTGPLPRRRGCW
jgi:hypothetical protein